MSEYPAKRRLAAIMVIDIVGYSRLVGENEVDTLNTWRSRRENVLEPVLQKYRGLIVKYMGDGALVEFPNATEAVESALELQKRMTEANAALVSGIQIVLRIGINVGDVLEEDGDIYGEGVNIAARLEPLSPAGGICVSESVIRELDASVTAEFEDLGEISLKNIVRPVAAYRTYSIDRNSGSNKAAPFHEKPVVAVLPFDNMSEVPGQQYFADGITENIITNLSRFRDLSIIARNSTFAYRGKAISIDKIGLQLGARYILEGSVQRTADRVRVTAQLIEAATGKHLWAGRYDRQVEDIFAVQDEIAETIVGTLASGYGGRISKAWEGRPDRAGVRSFQAFDRFLLGMQSFDLFTRESVVHARELFLETIQLDPQYAKALAKLAWTHIIDVLYGWSSSEERSWELAWEFANRAVVSDDDEPWGHWARAGCYVNQRQHDRAITEFEHAIALNPNDADVLSDMAWCLSYAGRAKDAIELALRAIRLNPHYPSWYSLQLGAIYFDARLYEKAVATFEALPSLETALARLYLAASYAALDQVNDARQTLDTAREIDSRVTISHWTSPQQAPYRRHEDVEHFRHFLAKAGVPQ